MLEQVVRGRLLIPRPAGGVTFHPDGALAIDSRGMILFGGDWYELQRQTPAGAPTPRISEGIILPPLIDIHTHIPQYPIRGRFLEGVNGGAPHGRLLAGLARNVFPAEIKCNSEDYARGVIEDFAADVLANGVLGGAAFMMVSAAATELALQILPETWSVGLVMMNQNCPTNLRTDERNFARHTEEMAAKFGRRAIVTDRFAVSTTTALRREGSRLAGRLALRTQTHLNEQIAEKEYVERTLYPEATSYTDIYLKDGLLDHDAILAHCVHMRPDEWRILALSGSVIAHCPTSNLLLGSGVAALDQIIEHAIPYAIATDMGASPTVSMLAEMGRFLRVHDGRSGRATPSEALWRSTLAPALILGLENSLGRLEPGRPASFIEVKALPTATSDSADDVIRSILPEDLDHPAPSILRVTVAGKVIFEARSFHA